MITARTAIPKVEVTSFKSQALRDAAREAPCCVLAPGCRDDRQTSVLAHSDSLADGNGWATKGHDADAFAACAHCHAYIGDARCGTREEREELKRLAHKRWWRWLLETGRVRIGPPREPKVTSKLTRPNKIVPRDFLKGSQ